MMDDFGINEMLDMQKTLQDKYKDTWETISPEIGQNKLLWMIGETGEVIDIIKKHGAEKACKEGSLMRRHNTSPFDNNLIFFETPMIVRARLGRFSVLGLRAALCLV